jgi:prevent-host-death family protein
MEHLNAAGATPEILDWSANTLSVTSSSDRMALRPASNLARGETAMTVEVQLDEAKRRLRDLIEAAIRGEDVLIVTEGHKAVRLAPVESPRRRPIFGSAKGQVTMTDDFDAPLDDFKEYES